MPMRAPPAGREEGAALACEHEKPSRVLKWSGDEAFSGRQGRGNGSAAAEIKTFANLLQTPVRASAG